MVREYFNTHPLMSIGAAIAVPVMVLSLLWYGESRRNAVTRSLTEAWYTDDDGKTWYADEKSLEPPIDHDGKTAVRAFVFTCDEGKHEFVAFLERYTPEAKQALDQARERMVSEKQPPPINLFESITRMGMEVKKPGDSEWVNVSNPKAVAIRKLDCPEGGAPQEVTP